jgi:hypothetical protein
MAQPSLTGCGLRKNSLPSMDCEVGPIGWSSASRQKPSNWETIMENPPPGPTRLTHSPASRFPFPADRGRIMASFGKK